MNMVKARAALVLLLLFCVAAVAAADPYYCPMFCEGKKTYDKPGECPVCHMNLEKKGSGDNPQHELVTEVKYRIELKVDNPREKTDLEISLWPKLVSGKSFSDFPSLKVDIVAQDLSSLDRAITEKRRDGFVLKHRFERGGNYVLFARFTPNGDRAQTFPLAVRVEPPVKSGFDLRKDRGTPSAQLRFSPKPKVGKSTQLDFYLSGKFTKGALSRLVVISEDTTWYFENEQKLVEKNKKTLAHAMVKFPQAGFYRVWAEVPEAGFVAVKTVEVK